MRSRRGATLTLVAVMLVPLLGVLGIAIDVGNAYRQRRIAQTAADAGAVAAAYEIYRGMPDSLLPSARNEASRNGFTNGVGGVVVTATNPPSTGYYTSSARFVEVSISNTLPTIFARVMGVNSFAVTTRAVAGIDAPSNTCVFLTSPTANPALSVENGASLTASNCGIQVNSNGASAIQVKSGASEIDAGSIGVRGSTSVSSNGTISPAAITGLPLAQDPLSYLQMPAMPSGCTYTNKIVSSNETLSPGTYCGGLTVEGGSTRATLTAGNYFMVGGGLTVKSNADLYGTGVAIINTFNSTYAFAPLDWRSGSDIVVSAPTSGDLTGIVFYEDPSAPGGFENTIASGTGSTIVGSFYFPVNKVVFDTGSSLTISGGIVAKTMVCRTSGNVTFTGYTSGTPYALKRVSLVE